MEFGERLQILRKKRKMSQEDLAQKINVSRQAVAKWETGQSFPDIYNLITLSELFHVSIDALVKEFSKCAFQIVPESTNNVYEIVDFLCEAKKKTYAGKGQKENIPSRPASHDLIHTDGTLKYIDTYVGDAKFSGEEGVWIEDNPVWIMNYSGRVLGEGFSGDFLKEVLLLVPKEYPFRGPMLHKNGDFTYHLSYSGDMEWFQGVEDIYYDDVKVYECYFHGGKVE